MKRLDVGMDQTEFPKSIIDTPQVRPKYISIYLHELSILIQGTGHIKL